MALSNNSVFLPLKKAAILNFTLVPTEDASLPAFTGHLLRAALLDLLSQTNKDLVEYFHQFREIRPYSITPIKYGRKFLVPEPNREYVKLFSTNQYLLSMRFITQQAFLDTLQTIIERRSLTINLNGNNFMIPTIGVKQRELYTISDPRQTLPHPNATPNIWDIYFLSPTQFKQSNDLLMQFPLPEYIFNSLFRVWEKFLPLPASFNNDEFQNLIKEECYVRKHELYTVEFFTGKGPKEIGFMGFIQLICKNKNSIMLPFLTTLLELGQIMNIGSKRTIGMGVMRYKIQN